MALVSYKCPNCGGSVVFDPKKQKFCCEFCMNLRRKRWKPRR